MSPQDRPETPTKSGRSLRTRALGAVGIASLIVLLLLGCVITVQLAGSSQGDGAVQGGEYGTQARVRVVGTTSVIAISRWLSRSANVDRASAVGPKATVSPKYLS